MGNMLRGRRSRAVHTYECPYGCCRRYTKRDRNRKHLDKVYRAVEKRLWKKELSG